MKSLDQVESRTPISSLPMTISASGSYYLTGNLSVSSGDAITVTAHGVSIDLNGFTISSTSANPSGTAILFTGTSSNVTVKNGFIQSGITRSDITFSGSGFLNGMYFSSDNPKNVVVSHVSVAGVLKDGIDLGTNDSTVAESCTVRVAGGAGIVAWHVRDCAVRECGNTGIVGGQVQNSTAWTVGSFTGLQADNALNCSGVSNTGTGLDVSEAMNCNGNSFAGTGLKAVVAMNCRGGSTNGDGMHILRVATNCFGLSTNGRGLFVEDLNNSSDGIANSCYGATSSSNNDFAGLTTLIAIGCYGSTSNPSGYGIACGTANSSYGTPNIFVFAGGKWDMP